MLIYTILILVSGMLISLDITAWNHDVKKVIFVCWALFVTLVAALRAPGVDRDSVLYKETLFDYMGYFNWREWYTAYTTYGMEIGYVMLNKTVYSLGAGFQWVLAIVASATALFIYSDIYKYSKYPFLSFFLYMCMFYFLRDFTQIRFGLASGIMMHGLHRYSDGMRKKGWFYLFLAILFHSSVIIGIVVPWVYKTISKYYKLFLVIAPCGYLISVLNPIARLASVLGLPAQVIRYLNPDVVQTAGYLNSVFMLAVLAAIAFYYWHLRMQFGLKIDVFYTAGIMSIFIGLSFTTFPIMQRLSTSLFTCIIFLIPYLVQFIYREKKQLVTGALITVVVTAIFGFYGVKMVLVDKILAPYSTFLNR